MLSSNWKYLPSRELVELSSLGKSEIYSIHYLLFDDDFLSLRANSPGRYCAPPPERPGELVPRLDFLNPFDIKPILRACLHEMGGPRSSGVGFFCFHALGDIKQKKHTLLDRGPPLNVNTVLKLSSIRVCWYLTLKLYLALWVSQKWHVL